MSVWSAYKLGVRLQARRFRPFARQSMLRLPVNWVRCLAPIDYVRYREFEFAFAAIRRYALTAKAILDISSPKLAPLTVAACLPEAEVRVVNILPEEASELSRDASYLGLSNLIAEVHDARSLGYLENSFDLCFSLSVFEHIAPEQDGELPAVRELGRVLARGGIAVLTLPFALSYFAEYRTGRVYERASRNGEPIFFQRFYDRDLIRRNIVEPSGLNLAYFGTIEEQFFFADPHKRLALYINGTPRQNLLFGSFYPLLSRIFLSKPKPLESCRKPYIACLVLRKV